MTYELAKQLKDAGFPQTIKQGRKIREEGNYYNIAYAPTLSELIEACGEKFEMLIKHPDWEEYPLRWEAVGNRLKQIQCEGNTPEEAVSKLWLELNKKHE